uniref:tRNA-splicing endonuclease subunit alpha n=1 Tax=uncultured marine group II/III euryarchaeote KM3_195_B08 TaxID=1457970 RepID=A0A075GRZ7_9EURY|nr:tRNA-splicing endonuclease subunit alpha [uncultured marine group II/III euryarchaeote KM3_195_B08]
MIKLEYNKKKCKFLVKEPEDITSLVKGFYGDLKRGVISIYPEEVLYLMDIRNGRCYDKNGNSYLFNDVAALFTKKDKFFARYMTYKDWRDRGLIARYASEVGEDYGRSVVKKYKYKEFTPDAYSINGVFFPDDMITTIDDEKSGKELYERYWIGQFGTYKAHHRGKIGKLDIYETIFMLKHGGLRLKNSNLKKVIKIADDRIKYFSDLYSVYEEWRRSGYVTKSGFKFGTHFRIYAPGASPVLKEKWIHSKHVVHVFSRRNKMLISEWARAIRVAHSVRKTFILAIPGKELKSKINPKKLNVDFLLYHRKKGGIETPKDGKPKYFMFSLSEDEYLGGEQLAKALRECREFGLEMLMAIADRESSVTYYKIRRISLTNSKYEYFEIEWEQP